MAYCHYHRGLQLAMRRRARMLAVEKFNEKNFERGWLRAWHALQP